jgi:hypothetical protein
MKINETFFLLFLLFFFNWQLLVPPLLYLSNSLRDIENVPQEEKIYLYRNRKKASKIFTINFRLCQKTENFFCYQENLRRKCMEIDEKKLWAECGRHRWRWSKKNGNT